MAGTVRTRVVFGQMHTEPATTLPLPAGGVVIDGWAQTIHDVPGELAWSADDPHRVVITFRGRGTAPVSWHIARDVLVAGLYRPAGIGDVSVLPVLDDPATRELIVSGTGSDGTGCTAGFLTDVADLVAFLTATGVDLDDLAHPDGCGREGQHR